MLPVLAHMGIQVRWHRLVPQLCVWGPTCIIAGFWHTMCDSYVGGFDVMSTIMFTLCLLVFLVSKHVSISLEENDGLTSAKVLIILSCYEVLSSLVCLLLLTLLRWP